MAREEIIRLAEQAGVKQAGFFELERFYKLAIAQYEQDAKRYHWLKKNIRGGSIGTPIGWFDDDVSDWDKDIDAAMEQTK